MSATQIYHDLNNPIFYTGINNVAKVLNKKTKDVRRELAEDFSYSLHKPRRLRYKRLATIPSGLMTDLQIDLAQFDKLARYNYGNKFCLLGVDVMSRIFFAEPLKLKSALDVTKGFKKLLVKMPQTPVTVYMDKGKEFDNSRFKTLLKEHDIQRRVAQNSDVKAAVVERGIRTLKQRLYKYFTNTDSLNRVDVLDQIINNIKNTVCRTTGMKPVEINNKNWYTIWKNLYSPKDNNRTTYFKVGDLVRIVDKSNVFAKRYVSNYTDELFEIVKNIASNPISILLQDQNKEPIKGKFYPEELSLSSLNTKYKIDKIIKKRTKNGKTEAYVKWMGYPPSFNSWIVL